MKKQKFTYLTRIFAILLILYSASIILFVLPSFTKKNYFESKPLDVIEVKTSIYQRNASPQYPIGALTYGENIILLENKSNEKISTYFILEVQNMSINGLIINSISDSAEENTITLNNSDLKKFKIPFSVLPHSQTFINLNVTNQNELIEESNEYPVSIISWGFRNE